MNRNDVIDHAYANEDPNDRVSIERQAQLIAIAEDGYAASAIRQAIREAVVSVRYGVVAPAVILAEDISNDT